MDHVRKAYPSDVSDDEWVLVAPYLALLREDVERREHSLREVLNGLRYVVKTGCPWRWIAVRCGARAPAAAAREHGMALEVVKLPEAKRGFVLPLRRWVMERGFAWATRFRTLVKKYEGCASTLADLHLVTFARLMLRKTALLITGL